MDQFSAHLDRGWDLVQRGDTRGAEASARRALEIDPQSPEAYNLLGYVAALEGETSDAIESYRQAIALDETYLEAMLNAAEVYIHPLGEFDEAIEMCDQALDLAETDEESHRRAAAQVRRAARQGRREGGRRGHRARSGRALQEPNHAFLIGPRLLRDRRHRSSGRAHRRGARARIRTTPKRTTTSASFATSAAIPRAPPTRSCAAASSTSIWRRPRGRCRASCSPSWSTRRWLRSIPCWGATCAMRAPT